MTPGVSIQTTCDSSSDMMPTMRWRVVWALRVTMDSFCPSSALRSVLLPALGYPMIAT